MCRTRAEGAAIQRTLWKYSRERKPLKENQNLKSVLTIEQRKYRLKNTRLPGVARPVTDVLCVGKRRNKGT